MDLNTRIKTKEQELVHGKGMTIFELADKLNKSYSYLCRISSPTEELPFPIELAVPAMKLKKNFDLLKTMALECGFALVKLPKATGTKGEKTEIAADYQEALSKVVPLLLEFFTSTNEENFRKINSALEEIVAKSLGVKRYVNKIATAQLELDL
jgi:hypothetical protein